jgi:hypothetical protein
MAAMTFQGRGHVEDPGYPQTEGKGIIVVQALGHVLERLELVPKPRPDGPGVPWKREQIQVHREDRNPRVPYCLQTVQRIGLSSERICHEIHLHSYLGSD